MIKKYISTSNLKRYKKYNNKYKNLNISYNVKNNKTFRSKNICYKEKNNKIKGISTILSKNKLIIYYNNLIKKIKDNIKIINTKINIKITRKDFKEKFKIMTSLKLNNLKIKMDIYQILNNNFKLKNYEKIYKNYIISIEESNFKYLMNKFKELENYNKLKFLKKLNNKLIKKKEILLNKSSKLYKLYNFKETKNKKINYYNLFIDYSKNNISRIKEQIHFYKDLLPEYNKRKLILYNKYILINKEISNYEQESNKEFNKLTILKKDLDRNRKTTTQIQINSQCNLYNSFFKKFTRSVSINISNFKEDLPWNNESLIKHLYNLKDYKEATFLKRYANNRNKIIKNNNINKILENQFLKLSYLNKNRDKIIKNFEWFINKKKNWNIYDIFHNFNRKRTIWKFNNLKESIIFSRFLIESENKVYYKLNLFDEQNSFIILSIFKSLFRNYINLKKKLNNENIIKIKKFIIVNKLEILEIFKQKEYFDLISFKKKLKKKNLKNIKNKFIDLKIYYFYQINENLIINKEIFFN